MSAPKVPPGLGGDVPPHLQGMNDEGMPKALPFTSSRFSGKGVELKQGDTYTPGLDRSERGGVPKRGKGRAPAKEKPQSSRAKQLEELRNAPQWAQPGTQMSATEEPSQEDMMYLLMNQNERRPTRSKFVHAFGKNAAGEAMADQMTEYSGMPTGANFPPDATMGPMNDQALLDMIQQQMGAKIGDTVVDTVSAASSAPPPAKASDSYANTVVNWLQNLVNSR